MANTTKSLLRETYGPRRRLVCAIDGLKELIWQDDGTGIAPTRPDRGVTAGSADLIALETPDSELSWGLDIGEMEVKPSAMTIAFRDIYDPLSTSTKFFGKMFAPGRHSASTQKSVHLERTTSTDPYVLSSATTIKTRGGDLSSWTATNGLAYTARETFFYADITGSTFTNCTRGIWPCTALSGAGSWTPTYKIPDYSASLVEALGIEISTAPYTWIGRRIALHVVAYDEAIGAWRTNVSSAIDASLMWIGRINSIRYNGQRGTWEFGCEHILADLEEKICNGMPTSNLHQINLQGPQGIGFAVEAFWGSGYDWLDVAIPPGQYTHESLAKKLDSLLGAMHMSLGFDGERYNIAVFNYLPDDTQFTIYNNPPGPGAASGLDFANRCHALNALGFGFKKWIEFGDVASGEVGRVFADGPPAAAYHPLSPKCNGGKLYINDAALWDGTRTDGYGANNAAVEIKGAVLADEVPDPDNKGTYHCRYSALTQTGSTSTLTLLSDSVLAGPAALKYLRSHSYAAQWLGEEPCTVANVYIPNFVTSSFRIRGPFELLLYPLLSTGTAAYNDSSYDSLPLEISAAMDKSLVDIASFTNADLDIAGNALAQRRAYVISEAVSWMDLLKRECKLFGYVLAWDAAQSKLALRSAYAHNIDTYTETISDSNGVDPEEFPDVDISVDTTINRWELSILHDRVTGKYKKPIIVEDEDSIQQLRTTKTVSVQHPGVYLEDGVLGAVDQIVGDLFRQNRYCWRYPWMVVSKTLAPYLFNRISIGDIVWFVSDRMPDPYGSGTMSADCAAFVLNLTWNPGDWTGKTTLLLYSAYSADLVTPWAWSALITSMATAWSLTSDAYQALDVAAGTGPLCYSLAFDGDDLLYVGLPYAAAGVGEVQAWRRSGATWTLERTIANPDAPTATEFGATLTVPDAGTIVIGAPNTAGGGKPATGAIHVFINDGAAFEQTLQSTSLITSDYSRVGFWRIDSSSNRIVAGNPMRNWQQGGILEWTRSAGVWTEQTVITGEYGTNFGAFLAHSGSRLVGCPYQVSYFRAFTLSGSWSLGETITLPVTATIWIEDLSMVGDTLCVGFIHATPPYYNGIHIYHHNGSTWGAPVATFGDLSYGSRSQITQWARVSDDEHYVYVGEPGPDVVRVYSDINGVWELLATIVCPYEGTASHSFGQTVAASGDYVAAMEGNGSTGDDGAILHLVLSSTTSTTHYLTLAAKTWGAVADSDDAAEAKDGDIVDIIERAPTDPTAEQKFVGLEVLSDYETAGENILTVSGGMTGWDSSKQYIVVPSVYSGATTSQKVENAYQGDASTGLLGSDPPHRYG